MACCSCGKRLQMMMINIISATKRGGKGGRLCNAQCYGDPLTPAAAQISHDCGNMT